VWINKYVKIRIVVFKQQFSLFKHCYQMRPKSLKHRVKSCAFFYDSYRVAFTLGKLTCVTLINCLEYLTCPLTMKIEKRKKKEKEY